MLQKVNALHGFTVRALDGEIGRLTRLYFDDRYWKARFIHTTSEAGERLIPIALLSGLDHDARIATLGLRMSELDAEAPMLIEDAAALAYSCEIDPKSHEKAVIEGLLENRAVSHLRSTTELDRYTVHARDIQAGRIEDLIVDEESWVLRYFIIDTGKGWPAKATLLSPEWISSIRWNERVVHVDLDREQILAAPSYDRLKEIIPSDEAVLAAYYHREKAA